MNKIPLGGGQITIVASGQNDPFAIDVAGGTVYWTNYNTGGGQGQVAAAPTSMLLQVIEVSRLCLRALDDEEENACIALLIVSG